MEELRLLHGVVPGYTVVLGNLNMEFRVGLRGYAQQMEKEWINQHMHTC